MSEDRNREEQARRDLERMEREREKLLHGPAPSPGDADDPIERLGRRIARILGPVIAAALIVYLFATYMT